MYDRVRPVLEALACLATFGSDSWATASAAAGPAREDDRRMADVLDGLEK
jgi:hypothetical protein